MTTAHRPTWHAVLGGENQGGNVLVAADNNRARDQPALLKLKYRDDAPAEHDQSGQLEKSSTVEDDETSRVKSAALKLLATVQEEFNNKESEGVDQDFSTYSRKRAFPRADVAAVRDDNDRQGSEESSDDSDSEDLMTELAKIREEKVAQKRLQIAEKQSEGHHHPGNIKEVLLNNPLRTDVTLRREWQDDAVFRNQAPSSERQEKRFINDTVRSDFHRKFLQRYIR